MHYPLKIAFNGEALSIANYSNIVLECVVCLCQQCMNV